MKLLTFCALSLLPAQFLWSQQADTSKFRVPELKVKFNPSGSHYFKTTVLVQSWAHYSQLNPGSTIDGYKEKEVFDIGVRQWRVQAFGQLTDKLFVYTQFGQNNITYLQPRTIGAFLHDAVVEYTPLKHLHIGSGLTAWGGFARFSAAAVAAQLGVEGPGYQLATNGINDNLARKMSVYAKGEIGKLHYRVVLSKPLSIFNSTVPVPAISINSNWNPEPAKVQTAAYLMWQFFDKESPQIPYMTGTYFGQKKILTLGLGYQYQRNAMWYTNAQSDTVRRDLCLLNADLFGELPTGKKGQMIHFYVAASRFDFGRGYYRNNNTMNPANGLAPGSTTISGAGVLYPMVGTGFISYAQVGYKLRNNLFRENGSLMPYAVVQYSHLLALKDPSVLLEGGINWLIHGNHTGKITLALQNRPVFSTDGAGGSVVTARKNMLIAQFQIAL